MGDSIDLSAIFNEVNAIATLAKTSAGGTLVQGASALPSAVPPGELTWPGATGEVKRVEFNFDSWASNHGISTPTRTHIGGSWEYGGNHDGAGLFVKNFDLSFGVEGIGLGQSFSLSGHFDTGFDGDPHSPIAKVTAHIKIEHYYVAMLEQTWNYDFTVKGNGGQSVREV